MLDYNEGRYVFWLLVCFFLIKKYINYMLFDFVVFFFLSDLVCFIRLDVGGIL